MHTNKKEEIAKVIYELINQTIKTKNIITREFKKIYDYKFFINQNLTSTIKNIYFCMYFLTICSIPVKFWLNITHKQKKLD